MEDYKEQQLTPSELAIYFLANFYDNSLEEIEELPITHALTELIHNLVYETISILDDENEHTVH
jgi:hypothetical protein